MTTPLEEARAAFKTAVSANGELTEFQRRHVEAIISWNVDKLDLIEQAYADKIQRATAAITE